MQFFDTILIFFFIVIFLIVSFFIYLCNFSKAILFRGVTSIFAYIATHFFFLKRKADQDFLFFLIDPNTRVYCYIFAFFLFRCFFLLIVFSFFAILRRSTLFQYQEFIQLIFMFFRLNYLFFWSYTFLDIDLKKTFLFEFTHVLNNINRPTSTVNSTNRINVNKCAHWEISMYFFNFFGLFLDIYIYLGLFFIIILYFFSTFFKKYSERYFVTFCRRCTFSISMYCYSGESLFFDMVRWFFIFIFSETFLVYRYFFWILRVYKGN